MNNDLTFGYNRTLRGNNLEGNQHWSIFNTPFTMLNSRVNPNQLGYGYPSHQTMAYPEASVISQSFTSDAFNGAIVHPNGNIYFIPNTEVFVYEFNPITDKLRSFGSVSSISNKWGGGALAPNGNIYCAPSNTSNWLKIDVTQRTITLLAQATELSSFGAPILAQDGNIYAVPNDTFGGEVSYLNPTTEESFNFGNTGSYAAISGCMGVDGKIYCAPHQNSTQIGIIDPYTKTWTLGADLNASSSNSHFTALVLAPNGKMYTIPGSANRVMEYDPLTNTAKAIGPVLSASTLKWRGGFLGPDGMIYGVPHSSTTILKIDPMYGTVEEFHSLAGSQKWYSGVMHYNGIYYGAPGRSDSVLKLNFNTQLNPNTCLSSWFNKY